MRQLPDVAWLDNLPPGPFNQVLPDFDRVSINYFAGRASLERVGRRELAHAGSTDGAVSAFICEIVLNLLDFEPSEKLDKVYPHSFD